MSYKQELLPLALNKLPAPRQWNQTNNAACSS